MLTLLEVTIKCQLLHGLIEDQEYLNSHVTVLMFTAFPPSLNPALMVIFFLFSGSFSCLIWQGEVHNYEIAKICLVFAVGDILIPLLWNWGGVTTNLYFESCE